MSRKEWQDGIEFAGFPELRPRSERPPASELGRGAEAGGAAGGGTAGRARAGEEARSAPKTAGVAARSGRPNPESRYRDTESRADTRPEETEPRPERVSTPAIDQPPPEIITAPPRPTVPERSGASAWVWVVIVAALGGLGSLYFIEDDPRPAAPVTMTPVPGVLPAPAADAVSPFAEPAIEDGGFVSEDVAGDDPAREAEMPGEPAGVAATEGEPAAGGSELDGFAASAEAPFPERSAAPAVTDDSLDTPAAEPAGASIAMGESEGAGEDEVSPVTPDTVPATSKPPYRKVAAATPEETRWCVYEQERLRQMADMVQLEVLVEPYSLRAGEYNARCKRLDLPPADVERATAELQSPAVAAQLAADSREIYGGWEQEILGTDALSEGVIASGPNEVPVASSKDAPSLENTPADAAAEDNPSQPGRAVNEADRAAIEAACASARRLGSGAYTRCLNRAVRELVGLR